MMNIPLAKGDLDHPSHRFGGIDGRCYECDCRPGGAVATWPCGSIEARADLTHSLACPGCRDALRAARRGHDGNPWPTGTNTVRLSNGAEWCEATYYGPQAGALINPDAVEDPRAYGLRWDGHAWVVA